MALLVTGSGGEFMVVVGQEMRMSPTRSGITRLTPLPASLDSTSQNDPREY